MACISFLSWFSALLALSLSVSYWRVRFQALAKYERSFSKTKKTNDEPYHKTFSRSCNLGIAVIINWAGFLLFGQIWRLLNHNQLSIDAFLPGLLAGLVSILVVAGCANYCNHKESDLSYKDRWKRLNREAN